MESYVSATWPGWETVRLIGRGSFGAVYEIQRKVFDDIEKAALKVITIPQNSSDIDEMYSDGYDDESITSTFHDHLKSIVAEYSLMRKMNGSANIVNCDDVRYVQHDDGIGWDIFIKMELLTPLTKALSGDVTEETVVQIAKDMCAALELCKRHEIVHRDIKPQNIFVSPNGDYKLGDFGIAKTVEKTMGGTKIGTYKYMAPEVYNNQPYGSSADIYSLGLVLYWLLNDRRMPFLPLPPAKLKAGMDEDARQRRLSGESLPPPTHGSDELKRIVLKACAYDPGERYLSAAAMLKELKKLDRDEVENGAALLDSQKAIPGNGEDATVGPVFIRTQQQHDIEVPNISDPDNTIGPVFGARKSAEEDCAPNIYCTAVTSNRDNRKAEQRIKRKKILIAAISIAIILSVLASAFYVILNKNDNELFLLSVSSSGSMWVDYSKVTFNEKGMSSIVLEYTENLPEKVNVGIISEGDGQTLEENNGRFSVSFSGKKVTIFPERELETGMYEIVLADGEASSARELLEKQASFSVVLVCYGKTGDVIDISNSFLSSSPEGLLKIEHEKTGHSITIEDGTLKTTQSPSYVIFEQAYSEYAGKTLIKINGYNISKIGATAKRVKHEGTAKKAELVSVAQLGNPEMYGYALRFRDEYLCLNDIGELYFATELSESCVWNIVYDPADNPPFAEFTGEFDIGIHSWSDTFDFGYVTANHYNIGLWVAGVSTNDNELPEVCVRYDNGVEIKSDCFEVLQEDGVTLLVFKPGLPEAKYDGKHNRKYYVVINGKEGSAEFSLYYTATENSDAQEEKSSAKFYWSNLSWGGEDSPTLQIEGDTAYLTWEGNDDFPQATVSVVDFNNNVVDSSLFDITWEGKTATIRPTPMLEEGVYTIVFSGSGGSVFAGICYGTYCNWYPAYKDLVMEGSIKHIQSGKFLTYSPNEKAFLQMASRRPNDCTFWIGEVMILSREDGDHYFWPSADGGFAHTQKYEGASIWSNTVFQLAVDWPDSEMFECTEIVVLWSEGFGYLAYDEETHKLYFTDDYTVEACWWTVLP